MYIQISLSDLQLISNSIQTNNNEELIELKDTIEFIIETAKETKLIGEDYNNVTYELTP